MLTTTSSTPTDAQIFSIVVGNAVRHVVFWGTAAAIVGVISQWFPTISAIVAAPLLIILVVTALWCAIGIVLSALMAVLRVFGITPKEPYDAGYMWAAGGVRLVEAIFYLGYSLFLYRLNFG